MFSEELPWKQRNGEQLFGLPGCLRAEVLPIFLRVVVYYPFVGIPEALNQSLFYGMELQMLLF